MCIVISIRDLIHYRIKCSDLIALLNFYFPIGVLRESFHFRLLAFRSNIAFNNTIFRCMSITYKINNSIVIFENVSPDTFMNNVMMFLDQYYRS